MSENKDPLREEEVYIEEESPEIAVGENITWGRRILRSFPALKSRNYQLYFWGQLISLIGTWLQMVAQGWLVLKLTNSAFLVGLTTGLSMLPTLFLTLFGGVAVDRFPKKYILIFTQVSAMVLAFILGLLTLAGSINVWQISVLAVLLGVVTALDSPARMAYVTELVPREDLASAIALNSGIFNAARVIGPGIAGFLIAWVGTGGAFMLNGVSYIAVIIALFFITTPTIMAHKHKLNPLKAIGEGLKYSFSHPLIRSTLIFAGVVSIFGWSYTTLMPVIAQNNFHLDATGLGYLYAASGLGALLGTFAVSAFAGRISANAFIIGGNCLFAVTLILFTYTTFLPLALFLLFLSGFGLLVQFSMINTSIQHSVADHLRGRVMSIYTLVFMGLMPLGSIEIGAVAERFGNDVAIRTGAVIVLVFGGLVYLNRKKTAAALAKYEDEKNTAG